MSDNVGTQSAADGPLSQYIREIQLYESESRQWRDRSKNILRRYKDERRRDGAGDGLDNSSSRYNVLWSNTQTLLPALYSRNPKPDVQRRYKDADPIGRVASSVLERCISYFTDNDCFAGVMRQTVFDYAVVGRGTTWLRYEPKIVSEEIQVDDDSELGTGGDAERPTVDRIAYEDVDVDFVHQGDFGHNVCRVWQEVWVGWRIVYLSREELIARFKDKGKDVPLDHKPENSKEQTVDDGIGKASIYELWDKSKQKAVWLHKDVREPLDERPDPLKLKDFFPFPKPMFTNLANDGLIPVPDFLEYQDQAIELDNLTARIASITKSIKVCGVYDASAQGISRLLSEGIENQLIPVEQWAVFADKGGLQGAIAFMPLVDIVNALKALYEARDKVKQDMWEITGLSDIMRGNTDPDETASAQKLKSSYGTMRLSDRQRDVQVFARGNVRIIGEIICNHFQPETIKQISGVQLFTAQEKQGYSPKPPIPGQQPGPPPPPPPNISPDQFQTMMADPTWEDVISLLKNEPMRCFRIDIETDSTIKVDEQQDKASRVEFIEAIGKYLSSALPAAEQTPQLLPLLCQGLMFLARGFPVGKEFEGVLNTAITQIEKAAQNPQQKPDPELIKVQGEQQLAQQKQQFEQQHMQAELQGQMALEQAKAQAQAQSEAAKAQAQAAVQQHLNEVEAQRDAAKTQNEMALAREKATLEGQIEIQKAHIQAAASIEVARISAKASDGAAAETREASGES